MRLRSLRCIRWTVRLHSRSLARATARAVVHATAPALACAVAASATLATPERLHAQGATPDKGARDSVVAVVQEFFRSMHDNDPAAAQRIMVDNGASFATRLSGDSAIMRSASFASHFDRLRAAKDTVLERMWDPTVHVHGSVAVVWTPYDLFVNGRFSHCGIDAFTLVRAGRTWKVASVSYTVEPAGCKPSPLGPPASR
ncbi:MAG: nuclear transport factor 2 family protein [Gemmatimonadaceae bacterium]|nr:nuclear transport factor 2 family protein [Gemmatimonadaceae bacterium]